MWNLRKTRSWNDRKATNADFKLLQPYKKRKRRTIKIANYFQEAQNHTEEDMNSWEPRRKYHETEESRRILVGAFENCWRKWFEYEIYWVKNFNGYEEFSALINLK